MAGIQYKPVGIFWDIENCSVPKNKSASAVIAHIRNFFITNRLNHREYEFLIACDVSRIRKDIPEDVNKAGQVTLAHVSGSSKNAADEKLRENMKRFVDTHSTTTSPTLVLISGDIDFVNDLRGYQVRLGCTIILIHAINCSPQFKIGWNEIYNFQDFFAAVKPSPTLEGRPNEGIDQQPGGSKPQKQEGSGPGYKQQQMPLGPGPRFQGPPQQQQRQPGPKQFQQQGQPDPRQFQQQGQPDPRQFQQQGQPDPRQFQQQGQTDPRQFQQQGQGAAGPKQQQGPAGPKKQRGPCQNGPNQSQQGNAGYQGSPYPNQNQGGGGGLQNQFQQEQNQQPKFRNPQNKNPNKTSGQGQYPNGNNQQQPLGLNPKFKKGSGPAPAPQGQQQQQQQRPGNFGPSVNQINAGMNQMNIQQGDKPAEKPKFILMISGLPGRMDFKILKDHLQEKANQVFGKVKYVKNGQAFVSFTHKANADRAVQLFNGQPVYGKNLNVTFVQKIPFENLIDKKMKGGAAPDGSVMVQQSDVPKKQKKNNNYSGGGGDQRQGQVPGNVQDLNVTAVSQSQQQPYPSNWQESMMSDPSFVGQLGTFAGAVIRECAINNSGPKMQGQRGQNEASSPDGKQESCSIQ